MVSPIAENIVQPAVNPQCLAYCPAMDLIALATVDHQIRVYRLNGQECFHVTSRPGDGKPRALQWKPNGQSLAIAFSNRSLSLTNCHTGKTIHRVDCSKYSESRISCLGWGSVLTERETSSLQNVLARSRIVLKDVNGRIPQIKGLLTPPDLPKDLAFIETESLLPKLSPLSAGGIEDDIFSSRTSLDTIFQPMLPDSADSVDVLIMGFEDGTIHLSIYEFFDIGTFRLPSQTGGHSAAQMYDFHPCSTTHSLLVSHSHAGVQGLDLLFLDLRLISNSGGYLSTLASKSTQLQSLLLYIRQVQVQLYGEFKAAQELPRRFMANLEETLNTKGEWTWIQAAYHMVVTGDCPDADIKEWLVDQLGERGHKRWDKAVVTGYESVRRLTHENVLPALERFIVLASRLRGLSKFQVSNRDLSLSSLELDNVIDSVSCLQLMAHHILILSSHELRQFQSFSAWLRQEIDTQASGPNSSESLEPSAIIDHVSTLLYIEGALTKSALVQFLSSPDLPSQDHQWDMKAEDGSLFELFKSELQRQKGDDDLFRPLPRLHTVIDHLQFQCDGIFSSIAETQRRNVRFSRPLRLRSGVPKCLDMRMLQEDEHNDHHFTQYVAIGEHLDAVPVIIVFKVTIKIENGLSATETAECAQIGLEDWQLRDLRFADDKELLIACSKDSTSRLLLLPFRELMYRSISDLSISATFDSGHLEHCTWMEFGGGISWTPQRIEINGRKGRRAACVLAEDGFHYRVYDLESRDRAEDGCDSMGDAHS